MEDNNKTIKVIGAFSGIFIAVVSIAFMFGMLSNDVSTVKEDVKNLQKHTMTSEAIRLLVKDEEEDLVPKLDLKYYTKPQFDKTSSKISRLELRIEQMQKEIDELKRKR